MDPPVKNPARTSAQWLRYSATLTTPTSMARQSRVRLMVGLVSRVPLVLNTSVTYICRKAYRKARTVGYKKQRKQHKTRKHVCVITTQVNLKFLCQNWKFPQQRRFTIWIGGMYFKISIKAPPACSNLPLCTPRSRHWAPHPLMGRIYVQTWQPAGCLCRPGAQRCTAWWTGSPMLCSLAGRQTGSEASGFLSQPVQRWRRWWWWTGRRHRHLGGRWGCRKLWWGGGKLR